MKTVYKLTDELGQTFGGMQWGPGVAHKATGKGTELCTDGFIHHYSSPLLAVLLNPIGANFERPRLWEAQVRKVDLDDRGLKGGSKWLRVTIELELPKITREQRIRFGILCAKEVYSEPGWNTWAENWLSGVNRSSRAAWAAYPAYPAANAAYAAVNAVNAAYAAIYAAVDAVNAAYANAAYAAVNAAYAAVDAAYLLDLQKIAERAVNE